MDTIHVVHLEDDGPLRNIIRDFVQYLTEDVQFIQFVDSDELMVYVEKQLPAIDLFFLDIRVPGKLDGKEVAEKLRQLHYDCPIVVTSAYKVPSVSWLEEWQCEWVIKPTHAVDLRRRILPMARNYREKKGTS